MFDDPARRIRYAGLPDRTGGGIVDRVYRTEIVPPIAVRAVEAASIEPVLSIPVTIAVPAIVVPAVPVRGVIATGIATGIVPGVVGRSVIIRVIEKRIIEGLIGVIVRIVVIVPVRVAEEDRNAEGRSIVRTATEAVAPGVVVHGPVGMSCGAHVLAVLDHVIVHQIVVEVALRHPPNQLIQLRLRIGRKSRGCQCTVVPVVTGRKPFETEGLPRNRGVYGSS